MAAGDLKKLLTLELDFKPLVAAVLAETEKATSRTWGIVFARRTMAEQTKLYNQGRTTKGEIVTRAKAGYSAHNYGLAVDLCPMKKDGSDFDWNAPDDLFHIMADIAHGKGLNAGYFWTVKEDGIHDPPHIELPRWRQQRALWLSGKVKIA